MIKFTFVHPKSLSFNLPAGLCEEDMLVCAQDKK